MYDIAISLVNATCSRNAFLPFPAYLTVAVFHFWTIISQYHIQSCPFHCPIRTFCSTSSWKPTTPLISCPINISSQPIVVSLPARISSCTPGTPPPSTIGRHSPSLTVLSSIPRLIGSAMPNVLFRPSNFKASCVAVHCARRDSSGWALSSGIEVVAAEVDADEVCRAGPTPARRVS